VRRTYEESVRELERQGWIERGQAPTAPPAQRPRFDDDALGVQFFRTRVEDADFSNLTIPGTFFGRSEILRTSFRSTDLRNSTLCWNDFVEVDFSDACLTSCDLRAATFDGCTFDRADLRGALVSSSQEIDLSAEQKQTVVWSDEEPDGG
jgi:uncharacterized protein YjbI with pentapeptide repeats